MIAFATTVYFLKTSEISDLGYDSNKISYIVDKASGDLASSLKIILAQSGLEEISDPLKASFVVSRTKQNDDDILISEDQMASTIDYIGAQILKPAVTIRWYLHSNTSNKAESLQASFIKGRFKSIPSSEEKELLLMGDIIPARTVYYRQLAKGFDYPYKAIQDRINQADLALANLETTLMTDFKPTTNSTVFMAPIKGNVEALKKANISGVNLANNHSFNGGAAGFTEMLGGLEKSDISYFGGGLNYAQASSFKRFNLGNATIGAIGFNTIVEGEPATTTSPGVNTVKMAPWYQYDQNDVDQVVSKIKSERSNFDIVIVYIHWSAEYTHDPSDEMRLVAKQLIDAGADVIVGTHPHWVQGYEWYKNKLITYSLGNFIFDQDWSTETMQGAMLSLKFNKAKLISAEFIPYEIRDSSQPNLVEGDIKNKIINDIQTSAQKLKR